MKKWLLGVVGALVMACTAIADDVVLNPDHPDSYVVVKGDTLWDISARFLQDPWYWPEIWHVNPQIENPHLIFPGDLLNLIYVDGKPRITVKRGLAANTVKLSPTVRSEPVDNAIPAIPLDRINAFLSRSRFVAPGELEGAPYVVAGDKKHIVSGAGDRVYGRGQFSEDNRIYGIYRAGNKYTDPVSGEFLGMQAEDIGEAKLLSRDSDIATMVLNRVTQEVRIGDRFLPNENKALRAEFQPSAPKNDVNGVIIDVEGGVEVISKYDVVMINLGAREGLEAGNVMAIYKTGETVRDSVTNSLVKLPDERAGLLMMFKVQEKMSYALVLRADQALNVNDSVRMP